MLRITVYVTHLSGERLWDVEKMLPPHVQVGVNINLLGLEQKSSHDVEAPFVLSIAYTPSVGQISIKGRAQVKGDEDEIARIIEAQSKQNPPPPQLVQAVTSAAMADAILVSKTIGVPAPLPPLSSTTTQPKPETRYA